MKLQLGKLEIEVKETPFKLYDKDGNISYCCDSYGFEWWSEYDEKGNATHFRDSDGFEWWAEYDKDGNETYYRDSDGLEIATPRAKSCEGKVVEIEGKKYQLKEIK